METEKQNGPLLEDGLMQINEVADFLAVSRQKIYELMNAGELPFTFVSQARRIPRKSVIDLASQKLRS